MKQPISSSRAKILKYIVEVVDFQGYPPTVREIGAEVGLSSPASVHQHLDALVLGGYLQRAEGKARALWVTPLGRKIVETI